MSDRKVKSVQNWAQLRSVKEVEIFIGSANLCRRLMKDFSKICKPITEKLKGTQSIFTGEENRRRHLSS